MIVGKSSQNLQNIRNIQNIHLRSLEKQKNIVIEWSYKDGSSYLPTCVNPKEISMPANKIRQPLGLIELETGTKAIMPMHDFFLTYAFNIPENWQTLRSITNILYQACKDIYKDKAHHIELIEGDIEVKTQYEYLLDDTHNKRQDHLIVGKDLTFIEFHNRAKSTSPIEIRGSCCCLGSKILIVPKQRTTQG